MIFTIITYRFRFTLGTFEVRSSSVRLRLAFYSIIRRSFEFIRRNLPSHSNHPDPKTMHRL